MIKVSLHSFDDSMRTSILQAYECLDSSKTTEDLLITAIAIDRKKSLRNGCKNVYYSKEILQNEHYKKFEKVILEIISAFKRNQFYKIAWRLSKKHQNKVFQDDDMLNILDIDHFHVGEKSNGNVRTSELLYIYYFQDAIYLVDIFNHDSFFNQKILEIICENWENICEYDFSDSCQNASHIDDKTRYELFRKKHINSIYEFQCHGKKKIIATKGIMSNGNAMQDFTRSMCIHRDYEYFKNNIDFFSSQVFQYILNKYKISVATLNIKYIWLRDLGGCFLETQCNVKFVIGENDILVETI